MPISATQKKIPSRNCTSIAEGTDLLVIIFYLSRIYRCLLSSHYYVSQNKTQPFQLYSVQFGNCVGFRN